MPIEGFTISLQFSSTHLDINLILMFSVSSLFLGTTAIPTLVLSSGTKKARSIFLFNNLFAFIVFLYTQLVKKSFNVCVTYDIILFFF